MTLTPAETASDEVASDEITPDGTVPETVAEGIRDRGADDGTGLAGLVETVRDSATRLLSEMPYPPAALRLRAGEVTVELNWHAPAGHPAPGQPAPTALTGSVPGPATQAVPVTGPVAGGDGAPAYHHVTAPTVGVFYHALEPGAQPFVEVGDTVTAGQQVGIVEVMKLMIPVEADRSGRVAAVLVANGAPVEYGEPLLALDSPGSG